MTRVRDRAAQRDVSLATYAALLTPRGQDIGRFRKVLGGLSCRDDEAAAEAVPDAFGLAMSSVSRRFVRASAHELRRRHERRHDAAEWLVLLLDGKTCAGDQRVVALGVTASGEKRILGLVQTATENKRVLAAFFRALGERGFSPRASPAGRARRRERPARGRARRVRGRSRTTLPVAQARECGQPPRQANTDHLAAQAASRWQRPHYAEVSRALERLHRELRLLNESAAASLAEGLDETLTLHRLGLLGELGVSFKTTNLIESVMARLEARTGRSTRRRRSDQKLRWFTAALWATERQFRRVKQFRQLPLLDAALQRTLTTTTTAAA